MLDAFLTNPELLVPLALFLLPWLFPNNPIVKKIVTLLKDRQSPPPAQAELSPSSDTTLDDVYNALKKLDALECDCPKTKQAINTIFANRDKFRELGHAK